MYDASVERIYRYFLARTGCTDDAEDLTAETFRAALESFDRLRAGAPPMPWLAGIARHKLADHFRRSLVRGQPRHVPLDAAESPGAISYAFTPPAGTEEMAGQRLEMARVSAALRTLTADQAEALTLRYFAGLPAAEVAAVMGKREEAARKLIQRGLGELRRKLGEEPGRQEP
jgi:RNA polymerase sigma-70 factor (ECF subfamily)